MKIQLVAFCLPWKSENDDGKKELSEARSWEAHSMEILGLGEGNADLFLELFGDEALNGSPSVLNLVSIFLTVKMSLAFL